MSLLNMYLLIYEFINSLTRFVWHNVVGVLNSSFHMLHTCNLPKRMVHRMPRCATRIPDKVPLDKMPGDKMTPGKISKMAMTVNLWKLLIDCRSNTAMFHFKTSCAHVTKALVSFLRNWCEPRIGYNPTPCVYFLAQTCLLKYVYRPQVGKNAKKGVKTAAGYVITSVNCSVIPSLVSVL